MTEAQEIGLEMLDTPCQFCGAGIGEPCDSNCEALEANWPGLSGQPSEDDLWAAQNAEFEAQTNVSKSALQAALHRLPFSGSFMQAPNYRFRDTDDWLAELGLWLDQYNKYAKDKIARLENESRRAMALQFEKDVVRQYFTGIPPGQEKK